MKFLKPQVLCLLRALGKLVLYVLSYLWYVKAASKIFLPFTQLLIRFNVLKI